MKKKNVAFSVLFLLLFSSNSQFLLKSNFPSVFFFSLCFLFFFLHAISLMLCFVLFSSFFKISPLPFPHLISSLHLFFYIADSSRLSFTQHRQISVFLYILQLTDFKYFLIRSLTFNSSSFTNFFFVCFFLHFSSLYPILIFTSICIFISSSTSLPTSVSPY